MFNLHCILIVSWQLVYGIYQHKVWTYMHIFFTVFLSSFPTIYFEKFRIYRKVARRVRCIFIHASPRCTILPCLCAISPVLWHFLSVSLNYVFIFAEPFESSCRCHYISPLIIQQVSPKKQNILLHNHSTNNMLIQCCYGICSLYLTFSQLSQ